MEEVNVDYKQQTWKVHTKGFTPQEPFVKLLRLVKVSPPMSDCTFRVSMFVFNETQKFGFINSATTFSCIFKSSSMRTWQIVSRSRAFSQFSSLRAKLSYLGKRREPRENARARGPRKGPLRLRCSLARSRETRFTRPNRRACSQATNFLSR